ncbi:SRPBCC family protein [Jiangella rhizosphaerae]|uniref:SRPBCC domain-containing protein n=1 Tax=Jiangella rhizosphaerae TaxID=2293569 RepID=A0A418KHF5_9ACTN|nr:SRPBCC domain-containing protein [Jiangella rhizosphaerae]RIQ11763.1 SRPBCC domain-containing protein [Jiangella rhizosphaerae]
MMRTEIALDQFYPHPPELVWRALTTPELLARWLMPPDGFEPRVGARFTMTAKPIEAVGFSGTVACEVLELVEPELLSFSWDDAAAAEPSGWVVSFALRPEGRGTRLLFTHRGFDPDSPAAQLSRTIMGNGWRRILAALGEAAATTRRPPG